jgi:hypothetical protein
VDPAPRNPRRVAQTTCSSGKAQYASEREARRAMRHLPSRLRTYRCPLCRSWHLSNPEKE